jgi:hypothetical protein
MKGKPPTISTLQTRYKWLYQDISLRIISAPQTRRAKCADYHLAFTDELLFVGELLEIASAALFNNRTRRRPSMRRGHNYLTHRCFNKVALMRSDFRANDITRESPGNKRFYSNKTRISCFLDNPDTPSCSRQTGQPNLNHLIRTLHHRSSPVLN